MSPIPEVKLTYLLKRDGYWQKYQVYYCFMLESYSLFKRLQSIYQGEEDIGGLYY